MYDTHAIKVLGVFLLGAGMVIACLDDEGRYSRYRRVRPSAGTAFLLFIQGDHCCQCMSIPLRRNWFPVSTGTYGFRTMEHTRIGTPAHTKAAIVHL